jgi:hypothetical protein
VRAAIAVRERTRAAVVIHPADAAYARAQGAQLDSELAAGERVGPFQVVGVPGKSPGEVATRPAGSHRGRRGGQESAGTVLEVPPVRSAASVVRASILAAEDRVPERNEVDSGSQASRLGMDSRTGSACDLSWPRGWNCASEVGSEP